MSKIISIFTQQSLVSGNSKFQANEKETPRSTHSELSGVDTSAFIKVNAVSDIFNAVNDARRVRDEAEQYDVVVVDNGPNELDKLLEINDVPIHHVEVTDCQWEFLTSDSQAMEVFMDNIAINVAKLDLSDEGISKIADATNSVGESSRTIMEAVEESPKFIDENSYSELDDEYDDECDEDDDEYGEDDDEWDD